MGGIEVLPSTPIPAFELETGVLPAQQSILKMEDESSSNPISFPLDLPAAFVRDYDRLRYAWLTLARQHDVLRTIIVSGTDASGKRTFRQRVLRDPKSIKLGMFDEVDIPQGLQEPARLVLNWADGAPTANLRIPNLLADSTSLRYLLADFVSILNGGVPKLRLPYPDYVSVIVGRDPAPAKDFWADTLESLPPTALHSILKERNHAYTETSSKRASAVSGAMLELVAQLHGTSVQSWVYAAFGLMLNRHSQTSSDTALFTVEGRDRTVVGHESVIGPVDLEYPLRLRLPVDAPAAQAVVHAERMDIESSSYAYIGHDTMRLHHGAPAADFKLAVSNDKIIPSKPEGRHYLAAVHLQIGSELTVSALHDTCIPKGQMQVLLDHFMTALSNMMEHPGLPLGEIDIISAGERAFFMEVGKPLTEPVADQVHRLFERQVVLTPHAPAAQFETDAPISYDQLNRIANQVARKLPAARGSLVPVCVQRSLNLVVSLVAVLKTGAAYVTLDPETPQERNSFIVEDVDADFVIVDKTTAGRFPNELVIDHLVQTSRQQAKDTNLGRICDPSDPVYVIYTSGTSGHPKGVLHTHASATSGLDAFPTLPDLRQLLFHNPVFSAAQRSVWSTLKQGGCLCLASKENLTVHIGRTINQMQINVIDVTPSTALLIEPGTVPCLRRMTVAGELINPALIPLWADNKKLELLNAYGLSENTQVNWRRAMRPGQNPQNIGRPSDTTTAFVLEPGTVRLSPLLVPGELCLGGQQLAVRYLNRPDKTAEAFIENPFGPGRLYRTGDMVVAHDDGSIEMVGRIDFQVKINGQRVEPGDSNSIIQTHPGVYTSSVVSAEIGGRKVLVAVVIPKSGTEWRQMRSELKTLLKLHVPGYMMPAYWVPEKELPLNINGKVDIPRLAKYVEGLGRDHLLELSAESSRATSDDGEDSDDEFTPAALKLRDVWAEILNLPTSRISASDFFQELGGSSLDAIRCASKAHEMHLDIPVADILRLPLGDVAKQGGHHHKEVVANVAPFSLLPEKSKLDRKGLVDAYPTTPLQDAFLADSLLGNSTYVYRRYYRMQGNPQEFRRALESMAQWHPVLRATFLPNKTSFLQVIRETAEVSWSDLPMMTASEFTARPKASIEPGESYVQFAALQDNVLAVTMHHALFDYWSNEFLLEDLVATMRGQPPTPRPSFANFVHSFKHQDQSEMASFWQAKLQDATPSLLGHQMADNGIVEMEITENLQALTSTHRISPGSLVYAAWTLVLSMHTAQSDVVFGATLSGRDAAVAGILDMAGPTINTVPFRVQIDHDQSLLSLARSIQDDLWDYSVPAQLGLGGILRAAGAKADLYDTLVNVLVKNDTDAKPPSGDDDLLTPYPLNEPNYLDYTMLEAESHSHSTRLRLLSKLPPAKASLILGNVAEVIKAFVHKADAPAGSINPISEQEVAFVDSLSQAQPTEPGLLAHTLIERTAARHPAKTALRDLNGQAWSYGDLDTAATNLAGELRARGVRCGDIIPLLDAKAGAAYTPLDPKNPRHRNEFIIRDVGAKLVITDSVHVDDVLAAFTAGSIINMDHLENLRTPIESNQLSAAQVVTPDSLAYVIYTSGSTGQPKGVQVSHGAVGASTEGMIEACGVDQDWEVLWFLNYVFDASYFDVFTVLGSGGTVCIAPQDALIEDLAGCVNKFQVKQLMITPSISKLISPDEVSSLRTLLVCGEPITPELASTWASRMDVYNGYGPTEATILMTISKVLPQGSLKSIGYPLKAVKATILHPGGLQPVPYGSVGELCVSGGQVAMGYLNRSDITASAFLQMDDGSVLYRTGDYARWLPSGEIECLGRKDSQIKLNGYRIELGEIENAILGHTGDLVDTCVVNLITVQRKPAIVAFYVPRDAGEKREQEKAAALENDQYLAPEVIVEPASILDRLTSLAHYMVPKVLLPFWSFPMLPSGKINRKALKALAEGLSAADLAKYSGGAPAAVQSNVDMSGEMTDLEKTLRDAWAELFDIDAEEIGLADLFYHHGGDSIAAINLVSMLRRNSWSLSVNDCLSYPPLREQATRMKPAKQSGAKTEMKLEVNELVHKQLELAGLQPTDIEEIYPCAPGQVEFLTQGHTEDQFWQLMTVRRVPADFDLDLWTNLTRKLTAANQILRAMYTRQDPADPLSWVQIILKAPVLDLAIVECATEADKDRLVRRHWDRPFAVGKPFVRYLVLKHADGAVDICTKLDHAMYDGTLLRLFDDQFAALRDGAPMPKSVAFRDFVHYCADPSERARMLDFWKAQLAGSSAAPSYPQHITDPKVGGAVVDKIDLPVDAYALKTGVTASIVFQAAYTLLLSKLSGPGATDVTYDYLLTGRNVDLDDPQLIAGTCATFLPFRARFDAAGTTPVPQLLRDTQAGFWEMTEHGRGVGLGDIYRALGVEDRKQRAAKTLFLFQPFEPATEGAKSQHMRWIVMAMSKVTMFVNYAVMFEVFKDVGGGHRLKLQYDTRLFDQGRAREVMGMYVDIVRELVEREPATTGDLL
ncbi:nonribosomal peptide synthase [Apiospora marii]|uniref:nonribosomal peptide synthase n=1 Tax=Apiospora marii TaxID=335849 RepID=UPI003130627E